MNDEIEITPDEFLKLPKGSYLLIDIRNEASYQLGHIEGGCSQPCEYQVSGR